MFSKCLLAKLPASCLIAFCRKKVERKKKNLANLLYSDHLLLFSSGFSCITMQMLNSRRRNEKIPSWLLTPEVNKEWELNPTMMMTEIWTMTERNHPCNWRSKLSKIFAQWVKITGSSLTLAKMLRAEKCKQQAKMHQKKFIDNH